LSIDNDGLVKSSIFMAALCPQEKTGRF